MDHLCGFMSWREYYHQQSFLPAMRLQLFTPNLATSSLMALSSSAVQTRLRRMWVRNELLEGEMTSGKNQRRLGRG